MSIGGAGERVQPRARNRCDVDDDPLAVLSSSIRPRASMMGAKKFTPNHGRQTSTVVSI